MNTFKRCNNKHFGKSSRKKSQIINLNLIFNKKRDQGLDLFYKTTEQDDEIPPDLYYLTQSNHSNIGKENSQCNIWNFESVYYTNWKKYGAPSIQSIRSVPTETVTEQFIWKLEPTVSALNPFAPNVLFLYPLKTENLKVFWE